MHTQTYYEFLIQGSPIGEPYESNYWQSHQRTCAYCGQFFIPRYSFDKYCASTPSQEDDLYNPACAHGRWVESLSRKQFVEQVLFTSVEKLIKQHGKEFYQSL